MTFLVALPAFVMVERRREDPLLDLGLFKNRLFALGNLTSLLNGIARNGVLFLLVFYLQGVRGFDPVTAGILLAPLAVGLLVLSPISGAIADRSGSRTLATAGMIVTGVGLAGLALTISVDTPIWQLALWQLIVGAGSGLFASPNTSAVMGAVPAEKRGMGAGARMMLTQVGFMISIALALGLVTSVVNPAVLLAVFSGAQTGAAGIDLEPVHPRAPDRVRGRLRVLDDRRGRLVDARRRPTSRRSSVSPSLPEATRGGRRRRLSRARRGTASTASRPRTNRRSRPAGPGSSPPRPTAAARRSRSSAAGRPPPGGPAGSRPGRA